MFNYTSVQAELDESTWNDSIKQKIKTVLPQTGQFALSYLSIQLGATGSQNNSEVISDLLSLEPKWYELLNAGESEPVAEEMAELADSENSIKIAALLAIILDIRTNPALNSKLTPDLSSVMSIIEIANMSYLPENAVVSLIDERLMDFVQFSDLFMELRRYVYYQSIDGIDGVLLNKIEQAFVDNQLIIGTEPLSMGNQTLEPTVGNWLKDFIDQGTDSTRQGTFSVASYLSISSQAKRLSNIEQAIISAVFKFYLWLQQPIITQKEVEEYETNRKIITPREFLRAGLTESTPEQFSHLEVTEQPSFKIPLQKDLDLRTEKRGGLVFDQPTNVNLDDEMKSQAERKRNESAIQAKLEALKQKQGINDEEN